MKAPFACIAAIVLVAHLWSCVVPRCWSRDTDVGSAIPAAVTKLAPDELDCHDAIDVRVSPVPFGGGWVAKGCGRAAVYTCACKESKAIDECKSQCVEPSCTLYGCAEEGPVVMTYARDKCTWRK